MPTELFTAEQLKERYGSFYKRRRKLEAPYDLPLALQTLVPYAEVWGVGDDYEREALMESAPKIAKDDLLALFAADALYHETVEWLGDAADSSSDREAYHGVSCLLSSYESLNALRNWEKRKGQLRQ